jgi:putative membrane protein
MFVDYLTIMIINIVAGLIITGIFVLLYLEKDRKKVAPGFLVTGFISTVTGLHLIFTWPLPGSYNIPFGEMSLFYGILFFVAGIAVLRDWDLLTLAVYAVFAGASSILLGVRIFSLKLTNEPLVAMLGFVLSGLAGVLSLPVYLLRKSPVVRILAALLLLGAAVVWAIVGYAAYWDHMAAFGKWLPPVMRAPPAPAK